MPKSLPDAELQLYLTQVGHRILELRTAVGLNQDDFAAVTGLHRSYIGQLENGQKDFRLSTLRRVARTYGLQVHQLLDPDFALKQARMPGTDSPGHKLGSAPS